MKAALTKVISLLVFLAHTTGLCIVSHSPPILETRNWQLETDNRDWLGNQWTFTYDAAGRLLSLTPPASPTSLFSYDNAGRLSSWNVGTLAGRTITYDAASRRIRDDITAGAIPKPTLQRTALNTFDAADRLISSSVRYGQGADSTEHIEELFTYDGNGALTNWTGGRTSSSAAFTYDALGRLVTDGGALLCSYDALGNRLQTVGLCSPTPEIWIPNHADPLKRPLMLYDAEGDEVYYYYIWGGNRLLGVIENGELWDEDDALFVAHSDEIGSVIAFTDLSGNLLYSANYGSHGEDWGSVGFNPTPFAWLGGYGVQYLETDTPLRLYLTRHRVYSATLNRFLSSDPIGLAGGGNLYAYGEGNPMAYIDPLGLCGQSVWGAFWEGFGEGLKGGGSILANTFTFGYSDAWGWTDSTQYQGFEYDVSRFSANVAREAVIGLATVGVGVLAEGGSLTAQVAYNGIQLYNTGAGVGNVIEGGANIYAGNYLQGSMEIAGGALRAYGAANSRLAVAQVGAPSGMARVTSWADARLTPDLNAGRWVELGGATRANHLMTGFKGSFDNSITGFVPISSIQQPPLSIWWPIKSLAGQRILKP